MTGTPPVPVSPLRAGLACRCPACGEGPLYDGLLRIAPRCSRCGTDLAQLEQGDGPAVFVILILGFLVTGAALVVELAFAPPIWVHAMLWPPLIVAGAVYLLRVMKAWLCAQHYRHRHGHAER